MDPISPSDPAVRFAFQAATNAAGTIDPRDGPELAELLRHLKELESHLKTASRHDAIETCRLGIQITQQLLCRLHPTPADLLNWVHILLQSLGTSLGLESSVQKAPEAPARRPSIGQPAAMPRPQDASLRMAKPDGNRLGEVLVQMSYLKAADVERALAVQRQTNCRLGEAMVSLGLLTQKGLDAALRIQNRKRGPDS